MAVEYSARSHIGKVRENNEDNLFVDGIILSPTTCDCPFEIDGSTSFPAIFAVCDGMGGEENGELASLLAVQTLLSISERIKSTASGELNEIIQAYIVKVNEAIHSKLNGYSARTGTTLALVIAAENMIRCFSIGDSRIYNLQRSDLQQISNDHTLAAEQIRNGFDTSHQTMIGNDRNKLTRCIGIGNEFIAESYPPIIGRSRILICSDGLTDMVDVSEIKNLLRISGRTSDAANSLLRTALKNGGNDNVTLIVIDIKDSKIPLFRRFAKRLKGYSKA